MATVFDINDSRAVFDRSFAARHGVNSMSDTIKNARDKMRESFERADTHRQFVTMFTVAGMARLAAWHEKQAASESHMVMFWSAICEELSS